MCKTKRRFHNNNKKYKKKTAWKWQDSGNIDDTKHLYIYYVLCMEAKRNARSYQA